MMSEEAFQEFYQQTAVALRNYVARVLGSLTVADDIVQESFLRMLRYPPPIEEPQELRAYLFRIASNLIIDGWHRQQRELAATVDRPSLAATGPDTELRLDMQRIFELLRRRERQLLWLAYVEGANHREIAAALGLRERSIRVLLSRAREKVARLIRSSGDYLGERR
jgi:RNA polymerase sigma-70 factor, ECF subfamily